MEKQPDLIGTLIHWVAAGKLEAGTVRPVLEKLAGTSDAPSLVNALDKLAGENEPSFLALSAHLREVLRREALRVQATRDPLAPSAPNAMLAGLCLDPVEPWSFPGDLVAAVDAAASAVRDLGFLDAHRDAAPHLFRAVEAQASERLATAHTLLAGAMLRTSGRSWQELALANPKPAADASAPAVAAALREGEASVSICHHAMSGVLAELDRRWCEARGQWLARAGKDLQSDPAGAPGAVPVSPAAWDEAGLLATLQARFAEAPDAARKASLLDCACAWPTPAVVPSLRQMTALPNSGTARDRVMLSLTLRFGEPALSTWEDWQHWLTRQAALWEAEQEALSRLLVAQPEALRMILYSQMPEADPAALEALMAAVRQTGPVVEASALLERWAKQTRLAERRALLGQPPLFTGTAPPVIAGYQPIPAATRGPDSRATVLPSLPPPPPAVPAPPVPVPPSIWQTHVQPFFAENWYMVAGIIMVIFGSSLLAYFTWDKHWLVRYTIMPALLGLFTWLLAGAGAWIERRSAEFRGTAAILRGAAIALLPINFMAVAILSADPHVPQKAPALLAMALIYLSVFGWGLRRWCAAVEPALANLLAGALLLLNALVVVGPIARTIGHLEGQALLVCLGVGFYVGFGVAAAAIIRFTRAMLTREMAREKRVPWFVGASLALTLVQVFVWVHGFMRHLPQAQTYALLVILIGWLVLFAERRALALQETPERHSGESFLGFAFILLGVLMGFTDPTMRIVSLAAAGTVWLYQALARKHPLHYWMALTLWTLAGASVGLLPPYPGPMLPLLGVALAASFGAAHSLCRRRAPDLGGACRGMQVVVLVLTTMVAPLTQWHYGSAPLATAGWLAIVAGLMGWRAVRDRKLPWLHGTLLVVGLLLPYAGFMDVAGRTAHRNTMVFGLALVSWAWLTITAGTGRWAAPRSREAGAAAAAATHESAASDGKAPENAVPAGSHAAGFVGQARSTGLWFYGILAVAAMVLRVVLGDAGQGGPWYHDAMDYAGPILMMLVLIPATYFSRSLVPAGMAVFIMAILFPELRAGIEHALPWVAWGSGLESALWGLALVWLAFGLRPWKFLAALPEGDHFLGREPFPLRRYDHTLFTWPLLVAALFLIIKVDTWNLVRLELAGGIPLKTAVALGVTGVAWTFLAIYHRGERAAVVAVHLGWLAAFAGIGFGYWHHALAPHWSWPCLTLGLLLQGLYWLYRYGVEPARPWVYGLLTEPMRGVLLAGSGALSLGCLAALVAGTPIEQLGWLYGFLAAQLVWHAVQTRHPLFGVILFFHLWAGLLAVTVPGTAPFWEKLSTAHGLTETLWLLVAIQVLTLALERAGRRNDTGAAGTPPPPATGSDGPGLLTPLVLPMLALASGLVVVLALAGLADGLHGLEFTAGQQALLIGALVLTARNQAASPLVLLAAFLGYELVHRELLAALANPESGWDLLLGPWRLALLGLVLVLMAQAGRLAHRRWPTVLEGRFAQPFYRARSCGWLFWPAMVLAVVAAGRQTLDPAQRESAAQLWGSYLGAATFALVARFWKRPGWFAGAGSLLFVANIHLVRVLGGTWLRAHGLSELHLICLGTGITLLQATGLRRLVRAAPALAVISRACLGLAGLVLALLTANYITAPNVAEIQTARFIVSGVLAWLAGQYFRCAARHPEPGEAPYGDVCEALYHYGVVLAIWCVALLAPWFRQPIFTLIAIALPLAYFYTRAELGLRAARPEGRRYRNSAAVLGFIVLGLYVFRAVLHLVMFPGQAIPTDYYHYNAPLIMLLAIMMLRLHGLGGTIWLAFYGGVALMTGGYFLLTALPGFSPFGHPVPAAWCALGLGHFWILTSYARSPLRTGIQRLARLDELPWHSLRHYWGLFLLAATQVVTALGVADYARDTYLVAPLLAGAATILLHQGCLRRSPLYLVLAAAEFLLALHTGFLIPSYLPQVDVIWVLLGLWLGLLAIPPYLPRKLAPATAGRIAAVLAALVFAHVLYHRPWSNAGLWGLAAAAALAAASPARQRPPTHSLASAWALLLLAVPTWLIYFSQAPFATGDPAAGLHAWPVLAAAAGLFLTGVFSRLFPVRWASAYFARPRTPFRWLDVTLTQVEARGPKIHLAVLGGVLAIAGLTQVAHYQEAFAPREFVVLVLLEAALAVAWFYEGRGRQSMLAFSLMQIGAAAVCATVRRQIMLTTGSWHYEYDIWASLVVSFAIAGAKQMLDTQLRALRAPLLTTLLAVPAMALAWVIFRGLPVDLALIVVGLHSVLFVYLGKDDRESPYNILALCGFVTFVLLTFGLKLHLVAIHAYVIPVGLGVLILQHLFQQRIPAESRNWIRLVTLMTMLGSAGYYALADDSHAITSNLTLIVLGLLAMGLGSLLRIRLYLALGFAGLSVDLVSLLYKMLVNMERSARMTIVGGLVLALGAAVVFGAIYYKTNQAIVDGWIDHWRRKLHAWE